MEFLHLEDETNDEEEPDFQADFSEGVGDSDSPSDGLHTDWWWTSNFQRTEFS